MYVWILCRNVLSVLIGRYRPELHYMRGPGPKWSEKHGDRSESARR